MQDIRDQAQRIGGPQADNREARDTKDHSRSDATCSSYRRQLVDSETGIRTDLRSRWVGCFRPHDGSVASNLTVPRCRLRVKELRSPVANDCCVASTKLVRAAPRRSDKPENRQVVGMRGERWRLTSFWTILESSTSGRTSDISKALLKTTRYLLELPQYAAIGALVVEKVERDASILGVC